MMKLMFSPVRSWWQLGEGSGQRGGELALHQIECAFCEERGNWKRVFHAEKRKANSEKRLNFDVYQCGNCAGYVHVFWSASEHGFTGLHSYKVLPWPLKGKPKASESWPEQVQRFWIQAHQSARSEIWDGASVMARSAMQVTFREQGAVGRTLKDEVDDLSEKGLLPRVMKEWATELRLLGNEAAHPDVDLVEANPQDIRDALEFLDQLLKYLYDLPAGIRQYRERRAES
jgi:Domain of unknown function (DUF4145)